MSARSTSKIFIVRTYSNEIAPGRTYRRRSRVLSRTIVRRTDSRSVGLRQMIDAVMIVIRFAKKLARGWWRHKTSIDVESAPASDDEVSMSIERCGFADTKAKVVVSHNATQTDRQRERQSSGVAARCCHACWLQVPGGLSVCHCCCCCCCCCTADLHHFCQLMRLRPDDKIPRSLSQYIAASAWQLCEGRSWKQNV